jgi:hypothetical protein
MSEGDVAEPQRLAGERGSDRVVPWPHRSTLGPKSPLQVSFDRLELRQILNLYGRMVAAGEWRDYAIDFLRDKAVFSVFRHSSERALYKIEKVPALARRQGAYAVVAGTGAVLKRGHELPRVLKALEKPLRIVI